MWTSKSKSGESKSLCAFSSELALSNTGVSNAPSMCSNRLVGTRAAREGFEFGLRRPAIWATDANSTELAAIVVGSIVSGVVVIVAASGCALTPEFGAMYGDDNTSEARQATAIGRRIPAGSLVLADAGFGIFQVAHSMVGTGHDILFRLTKSRFKSMRCRAEVIEKTDQSVQSVHYQLNWEPSPRDRKASPDLASDACLEVQLHLGAVVS